MTKTHHGTVRRSQADLRGSCIQFARCKSEDRQFTRTIETGLGSEAEPVCSLQREKAGAPGTFRNIRSYDIYLPSLHDLGVFLMYGDLLPFLK